MLFFLTACFLDEKACDTMAVASVNLTITDSDGDLITDPVTVTWRVDGGDWSDCEQVGDSWACGWEVAGVIDVRVEGDGFVATEQSVTVEQGECHVEPEALTIVLDVVDCTDEALASVLATVEGSAGEALTGVDVRWAPEGAEVEPQPCDDNGDGSWVCGWEVSGNLEVTAVADGHAAEVQVVTVEADECHVITENTEFSLDWLPD